jgi:MarR family transcriptional regulator, negative regulator of the multidrug operon emrRAB
MSESYQARPANLLGALALAVCERLAAATERTEEGLAASEPAALVTLANYPGQSVEALRRTLGLTHSGAVRLADRLETAGLLRRVATGPGRTLALRLTDRGRSAAARVLATRQAALEQLIAVLSPAEAAALAALASRLLDSITADRASALRICRLCDEALCAGCPVDEAIS